jgi:hypothetical protein
LPEIAMRNITVTEFRRNFSRFQHEARRQPIEVTSYGRTVGYFVSEAEFHHYQDLLRREREVLAVGQLPTDALTAITAATYPDGRDDLDGLMDDEGAG